MPEDRPFNGQGITADGAVVPDPDDSLLLQFGDAGETLTVGPAPVPVRRKVRPVFSGPDRQLLIRIIHQKPVPVEQVAQHLLPEALHTGLKGQLGILPADIYRIILDAAGLADILISTVFADKTVLPEQTLPEQDKAPCLIPSDGQHMNSLCPRSGSQNMETFYHGQRKLKRQTDTFFC